MPEARDWLLLTGRGRPLIKNGLTLLFRQLSQRAGFSRTPLCPSMLRDTYAIRFLQAGGGLAALREQLGVAGLASVKRYQHFCQERKEDRQAKRVQRSRCPYGNPSNERGPAGKETGRVQEQDKALLEKLLDDRERIRS